MRRHCHLPPEFLDSRVSLALPWRRFFHHWPNQSKISRRSSSEIGQPLYSPAALFTTNPCQTWPPVLYQTFLGKSWSPWQNSYWPVLIAPWIHSVAIFRSSSLTNGQIVVVCLPGRPISPPFLCFDAGKPPHHRSFYLVLRTPNVFRPLGQLPAFAGGQFRRLPELLGPSGFL